MYIVEVCHSWRIVEGKRKSRFYVIKTNGLGQPFKEQISRARYEGFELQAMRADTFYGKTTKSGVNQNYKSLYFESVPVLFN